MQRKTFFRAIRKIAVGLIATLLVLLATLSALFETETGSRWVLINVASLAGVQVRGVKGNLREGLDVETVEFRAGQNFYGAQHVSIRWRPRDLLYGRLAIQSLRAGTVTIQTGPPVEQPPSSQPAQWPRLGLPLVIGIQHLHIHQIEWLQGERRQQWQLLGSAISWGQSAAAYTSLGLIHKDYTLHLAGESGLAFPYETQATVQWRWQTYMGVSEINGDVKNLVVTTQTGAPIVMDARVSTSLVNSQNGLQMEPLLQLTARWQQQMLPAAWWIANHPVPVTSGELTAQGNWKNYKAELKGDIHVPQAPLLGVSAAVEGDLEKIRIDYLQLRERYLASVAHSATPIAPTGFSNSSSVSSVPLVAALSSQISSVVPVQPTYVDADAGLTLQGDVRWLPQLEWHISAEASRLNVGSLLEQWPSSINATFITRGARKPNAWDIQLQNLALEGDLRGVNIRGGGSLAYDGQQLRSDELQLVFGANQVQLKGELGATFDLDWNINAPTLGQIDDSFRGSLVTKGRLRGDWRQPQIDIEATARQFSWGSYAVENLQLSLARSAAAIAAAKTALTQNRDANEALAAQQDRNEHTSLPPTKSDVNAIKQTTSPSVMDTISNDAYTLVFSANQLRIAGNRFSTLTINGDGSINNHKLQSVIKHSGLGRAEFTLNGEYRAGEWLGQFSHLALKFKKVPRWWLTASKPVRVSAQAVSIGRQCFTTRTNLTSQVERIAEVEREQVIGEWITNQSYVKPNTNWLLGSPTSRSTPVETYSLPQLCLDGEWTPTAGAQLNANLDSIPLRQFLSLFKTEVYFAGVMDGSVHVTSDKLTLASTKATATVSTRNAELRYQYVGGATEVYKWENFSVRADLTGGVINADAGMKWAGFGTISASSQIDLQRKTFNAGKLIANFSNLAPLETLLPYANDVKGDLHAELFLEGTFAQPELIGDIRLRNGATNLPRLGLDLSDINIQLNSSQSGNINLVGQLQSGDGRLSVVSDLRGLGTPNWTLTGFINGNNVKVISLSQLKATISPDIKVTANRELIDLTGTATIPWARTNFKRLPESATAVSADEVIVDEQQEQGAAESVVKLQTDLEISLGEDVKFNGFGLGSKLAGQLRLLKEAHRQLFTSGFVSIVDGTYKAYGQTLTIERGRLLFQGPYENPGLEIRASRIIPDETETKVGLDISGTLQRPKATVFSSQGLSDSQAMMMLLTGKPVSEASKADASLLVGAMSGLGNDSGGGITDKINRFFGVDELKIKSDDGFEQSELWVGKYLTPRLLVRYVVGIFDQAFGFGVEYQLTDRLRLEAESSDTQSLDIVYKIER